MGRAGIESRAAEWVDVILIQLECSHQKLWWERTIDYVENEELKSRPPRWMGTYIKHLLLLSFLRTCVFLN